MTLTERNSISSGKLKNILISPVDESEKVRDLAMVATGSFFVSGCVFFTWYLLAGNNKKLGSLEIPCLTSLFSMETTRNLERKVSFVRARRHLQPLVSQMWREREISTSLEPCSVTWRTRWCVKLRCKIKP